MLKDMCASLALRFPSQMTTSKVVFAIQVTTVPEAKNSPVLQALSVLSKDFQSAATVHPDTTALRM